MNHRTFLRLLRGLGLAVSAAVLSAGSCSRDIGDGDTFDTVTVRVSTDLAGHETSLGSAGARHPSVSSDGLLIAFESDSPELFNGDANGVQDVFLKDRHDGSIRIVSKNTTAGVPSGFDSSNACISSNGKWVVFESDASLDAGLNTNRAIFRYDVDNDIVRRVTAADFDADCFGPSISDDGNFVVFNSSARFDLNLAPSTPIDITAAGAYNNAGSNSQVFLVDMQPGTPDVVLLSRISGGGNEAVGGNGNSDQARISRDGSVVVFRTAATNLFADTNGSSTDIVLSTRSGAPALGDPVLLVSVNTAGTQAAHSSSRPSVSGAGQFVAFTTTSSTILGGAPGIKPQNIAVRDRVGLSTIVVTETAGPGTFSAVGADRASISDDGTRVAFETADPLLVGGGGLVAQVALWKGTGDVMAVSVHKSLTLGSDVSGQPSISSNGKYVAFESLATNLIANDGNGLSDIFVRGSIP